MEMHQLYERIRSLNKEEYGSRAGQVARQIAEDLHCDPTDVVSELLQNADDAGSSEFGLRLTPDALLAWNDGRPFSDEDVRALCGMMFTGKEKAEDAIGFFGIGFKSVFTWTDKPLVVSAAHSFEIGDYLFPYPVYGVPAAVEELREKEYTAFWLPLKRDSGDLQLVLESSGWVWARSLLFLKNVRSLRLDWTDGGLHVRCDNVAAGEGWVISVLHAGQRTERWLVYSRRTNPPPGVVSTLKERLRPRLSLHQKVSLGFCFDQPQNGLARTEEERVVYAYLPTHETPGLGFLVQAPFLLPLDRSRPKWGEPWNQWLTTQLSELAAGVGDSLCRSHPHLVPSFLGVPPLSDDECPDQYQAVVEALWGGLVHKPVVPVESGFLVRPEVARIPQSDVRKLVPRQLLRRMQGRRALDWVAPEVLQVPERREALRRRLGVKEFGTAELVTGLRQITKLDEQFLASQSAEWLSELYRFLRRHRVRPDDLRGFPLLKTNKGMVSPGQAVFFPSSEGVALQDLGEVIQYLTFLDEGVLKALDPAERSFFKDCGVRELSDESLIDVCAEGLHLTDRAYNAALIRSLFHRWTKRRHDNWFIVCQLRKLEDKQVLATRGGTLARPDECYLGSDYTDSKELEVYFGDFKCEWVDPVYLGTNQTAAPEERKDWCEFFRCLGVRDLPRVKLKEVARTDPMFNQLAGILGFAGWEPHSRTACIYLRCVHGLQEAVERASRGDLAATDLATVAGRLSKDPKAAHDEYRYRYRGQWYRDQAQSARWLLDLADRAWVTTSEGDLKAPRGLLHPRLRGLYGDQHDYLHEDLAEAAELDFWKALGVYVEADLDTLLAWLQDMLERHCQSEDLDTRDVEKVYKLIDESLRSREDQSDSVRRRFTEQKLILYRRGESVSRVSPEEAWWSDEADLPEGLSAQYDCELEDFFHRLGVPEKPGPAQLERWLLSIEGEREALSECMVHQLKAVYRALERALSKHQWAPGPEVLSARCWLGHRAGEWRLCTPQELVWVDAEAADPVTHLFSDEICWRWPDDIGKNLPDRLRIPRASDAQLSPLHSGSSANCPVLSHTLARLGPYVRWFAQVGPEGFPERVKKVDNLWVRLRVGRMDVELPTDACADDGVVWITGRAERWPEEYIGSALELKYRAAHLGEFVKDLWAEQDVTMKSERWAERLDRDLPESLRVGSHPTVGSLPPIVSGPLTEVAVARLPAEGGPQRTASGQHGSPGLARRFGAPPVRTVDAGLVERGVSRGRLRLSGRLTGWSLRLLASPPTADSILADRVHSKGDKLAIAEDGVRAVVEYERRHGRKPYLMAPGNQGYDIRSGGDDVERFIEVKATRGTWDTGYVGITRKQFETALELRERYWLYVVELPAGEDGEPLITRIQDPASKADYFLMDASWKAVGARVDDDES